MVKQVLLLLCGCVKLKVIRASIDQLDFDELLLRIMDRDVHKFQRKEPEGKTRG